MMLKLKVQAENVVFYYDLNCDYRKLPKDKIVPTTDALDFIGKDKLLTACRPVLTEHYIKGKFFLDYLFWFKEMDMKQVDRKVQNGSYSDSDFETSIKTQYVDKLRCANCNSSFKALTVDPVLIYPGNFELGDKKLIALRNTGHESNCPNCHHPFTARVVHIFE